MSTLRHAAIIMDGNNRWASLRGKSGISGHRAGVEKIRDVLKVALEHKVEVLTLFAFSSENWQRPPAEVEALMSLFYNYLKKEALKLAAQGVRLKVIGSRKRFSKKLQEAIEESEALEMEKERCMLVIAADYGGCWDVVNSAKCLAEKVECGELSAADVNQELFECFLSTSGFPPLDVLIRTGGDHRISNFLLYQAAYAELVFSDLLWPDFDAEAMKLALAEFYKRQRRFGKTGEQVELESTLRHA